MAINAAEVFAALRKGPQKMNPTGADLQISKKRTREPSTQPVEDRPRMSLKDENADAPTGLSATNYGHSDRAEASEPPASSVVDPIVSLRPVCFSQHCGYKGKDRDGARRKGPLSALNCGTYRACYSGRLDPYSATPSFVRLRTDDPEHDLKRWLLTLNERLCSGFEERETSDYLTDERFTKKHLSDALRLAVTEIQYEHECMTHLAAYAIRSPYFVKCAQPLAEDASAYYLDMDPKQSFEHYSREKLVDELTAAGIEVDYLRQVTEGIAQRVFLRKRQLARFGDWSEQGALVRAGYVSEEWVEDNCP